MLNRIWTWISAHRHFSIGLGLIMFLVFLYILTIGSCSSSPAASSPAPGGGYFFWKIVIIGLIVAAVMSRERPYLAITFSGLAILVFLVLLGRFDGLFVWAILGLPLFAAAGIYGATKTEGRTRSFLGFASGLVILAWLFMFAQSTLKVNLTFLGDRVTDAINLIIGLLAIGIFAFAAWRRNWIFFILSFVVLAAWLGPDVFNQIQKRFPSQLSVSEKTKSTWEEIWDSLLNKAKQSAKPDPTSKEARDSATTPSAPPPQATAPGRELQQRVITRNLKFVGGNGTVERQGFVEVQKGGHTFYVIHDMPWRRDAIFRVVVSLRQKTTGNVVLELNGGRGGQKYYMVPSSSVFGNAVFYDKGEIGRPEYFNPDGGNQILLSSQRGDMEIQYVSIVMIYWE